MTEKFIGFDIGGTKIMQAVIEINFSRRSFDFLDMETIKNPLNEEKIKDLISDYCKENKSKFNTNKVAISSASITDINSLKIFQVDNIYGVKEFSFGFLKKAGYQVVLENDGKSFALGQYYFKKNEDAQGLLTLTLGSGIGGGFINSEGQLLTGKNNTATEFGHIKMSIDGRWERWEWISAGRGIEKFYEQKSNQKKSTKEIFENINDDEIAQEVIAKSEEYLGQGIASLINIFNPEKIVFGGSISSQKSYLERAMKISEINIFNKNAFPEWEISELKAEMNVLGVCALYYV